MNVPYVKQYDEMGKCTNPITRTNPYFNPEPNRQQRRSKEKRFRGNQKGVSLSVLKSIKSFRVLQPVSFGGVIHSPRGTYGGVRRSTKKMIEHYT